MNFAWSHSHKLWQTFMLYLVIFPLYFWFISKSLKWYRSSASQMFLTLIWMGGGWFYPLLKICTKFCIPNSPQSLDIGQSTDEGFSDLWISSGQSFINKNSHNSITNYDIDMKLGPATKLKKRNTATSKTMTSCQQIVTPLSFFPTMANLQPSRSKIPDLWCLKLTFSLTKTFYFTKTENRAKKSLTQLSCYCFKVVLQPKMLIFCKKNVDISKIKEVLVLKGIFSKTTYIL